MHTRDCCGPHPFVETVGTSSGVRPKPVQYPVDIFATHPETLSATHEQRATVPNRFARGLNPLDGEWQVVNRVVPPVNRNDRNDRCHTSQSLIVASRA